jgi:hypothetical protein
MPQPTAHPARPRWPGIATLLIAIALACAIWWAFIITPWADEQTRINHAIWRANVPGLDLGLAAHEPGIHAEGYVQRWIFPHWAEDVWLLFRIPGAPARPAPPQWVTV